MVGRLRFKYTNYKGESHIYVVEPQKIHWTQVRGKKLGWYLVGLCVKKNGESRYVQNEGFPIRSFLLLDIELLQEA